MLGSSLSRGKTEKQWTAAVDRIFEELVDNAYESSEDQPPPSCLHRSDIVGLLDQAAKHTHVHVELTTIEDAVDTLFEDAHKEDAHVKGGKSGDRDLLSKEQFRHLFIAHPDLLRCVQDEHQRHLANDAKTATAGHEEGSGVVSKLQDISQGSSATAIFTPLSVYETSTEWKNNEAAWIWSSLYFLANIAVFSCKAYAYVNRPEATNVFGNCVVVARGSAQCLNLNCALILLPVCRQLLTRFRGANKYMRYIFPFDSALNYHICIGLAILLFTCLHVVGQFCIMHRFGYASEQALIKLFGNKLGDDIPISVGERWKLLLHSRAVITGIIMVLCMAIAYPMTKIRNTRFNHFWYSHHLLLLMLVMLCFHGTKCMLEPFQSVYWLMVPMMCYLVPRFLRETELSECSVLSVANQKGNVVRIRLTKPKSWEEQMHAGMYAYINVPQVSRLEWHPFTMTSSPSDSYIEFHVRRAGDWTGKLHHLLQEYKAAELGKVEMNRGSNATERDDSDAEFTESSTSPAPMKLYTRLSDLVIKVEGPIGAPSQGYSNFPIVVLVAAGIGVTPMISVLKELLDKPGKMKRVFFYWTVRDRESFEWFGSLMQDIYDEAYDHNEEHHIVMHIRPFLTSARQDDQDLGAVLLRCARNAKHTKTNFDLILGHYSHYQADIGRPNWEREFMSIKEYAKDELGYRKCGVFLCGPPPMAEQVSTECARQSKDDNDFHFSFFKETF